MWGSFKSYLGQYYPNEENSPTPKDSDEIEEGWVLVDLTGKEIDQTTKQPTQRLSPLPLLDVSNASTPQSSPQLSPTKIEEGWFVAPPPCFTRDSPGKIEVSPLEDLLIEHPSMSVYASLGPKGTCLPAGAKTNSEKAAKRTQESRAERTQVLTTKLAGNKSQLDLKNFVEQVENVKPSQHAKWENDQYKLCPSYINRQNRVHRYQSRKHHNQKKKSLVKPFAEKGNHGF